MQGERERWECVYKGSESTGGHLEEFLDPEYLALEIMFKLKMVSERVRFHERNRVQNLLDIRSTDQPSSTLINLRSRW
jgi:hypothetical protein